MNEFNGMVALVTGGGSGIGKAIAEALAKEGAAIAVTDINAADAQAVAAQIVASGGKARGYAHDVTDAEAWHAVVGQITSDLGPVDVLASNAGAAGCRQNAESITADFIRFLYELNVLSHFHALREVLPGMKARNRGYIMFTGSMASLWTGKGGADYSSTKHAVLGIADSLRHELEDTGITVSLLCPAAVATNLMATSAEQAKTKGGLEIDQPDPEAIAHIAKATADTGGVMEPEDIARITLDGMRAGKFFLITHPLSGARALTRHAELVAELEG